MVVRSDKNLDRSFRTSDQWGTKHLGPQSVSLVSLSRGGGNNSGRSSHSFSGQERNQLFLNHAGETFCNVSSPARLDSPKDSRSFVVWDYDRDGWHDVVFCNANAPLLEVHRNVIGTEGRAASRGFLAVSFVGGNRTAQPSTRFGPRDGFGARVTLDLGDGVVVREHRAGEGFAAQNSSTLLIGLGEHERVPALEVRWPSGAEQRLEDVPSGLLVVAYEDPEQAPDGSGFSVGQYRSDSATTATTRDTSSEFELRLVGDGPPPGGELNLYVTMATWCAACKRNLPQVAELRERFTDAELDLMGIPFDAEEGPELLDAYVADHAPAYRLVRGLAPQDRAKIREILITTVRTDALPSSIVTDAEGRVLQAFPGLPSVSDLRRLREEISRPAGG